MEPSREIAGRIALRVRDVVPLTAEQHVAVIDLLTPLMVEVLGQQGREQKREDGLRSLPSEQHRLLTLLRHAVEQADGWHASACGCGNDHGELMPECRATLKTWQDMHAHADASAVGQHLQKSA